MGTTNILNRILDFFEQPLFTLSIGIAAGTMGVLLFAPILVVCGVCILLAVHRAKLISGKPILRVQIPAYAVLSIVTALPLYGTHIFVQRKLSEANIALSDLIVSKIAGILPQPQTVQPTPLPETAMSDVPKPKASGPPKALPMRQAHIHFRDADLLPILEDNKITINLGYQNNGEDDAVYSFNWLLGVEMTPPPGEERKKLEDRLFETMLKNIKEIPLQQTIPPGLTVTNRNSVDYKPVYIAEYKSGLGALYYVGRIIYHDSIGWYHSDWCYVWKITDKLPGLCYQHNEEPRTPDRMIK